MNFKLTLVSKQIIALICCFLLTHNLSAQSKWEIDVYAGVIINPFNHFNHQQFYYPTLYAGRHLKYKNFNTGLQFRKEIKLGNLALVSNIYHKKISWEYHQSRPNEALHDVVLQRERKLILVGSQLGLQYSKQFKRFRIGLNVSLNYFIKNNLEPVKGYFKLGETTHPLYEITGTTYVENGNKHISEQYEIKKTSLIPDLFLRYYYGSNYYFEVGATFKFWGNYSIYQKKVTVEGQIDTDWYTENETEVLNISIINRWVYPKVSLGYTFIR